jgi:hypothetical protein
LSMRFALRELAAEGERLRDCVGAARVELR